LELFFDKAVADFRFSGGSIFFVPEVLTMEAQRDFNRRFTRLLGVANPQPAFSHLSEEQFETCFRELVEHPELILPKKRGVTVVAHFVITRWRIEGVTVDTESTLGSFYGASSLLSTHLVFPDMRTFEYLKSTLEEVRLCKLNPKHIKGR
jgi:hypothetical protein